MLTINNMRIKIDQSQVEVPAAEFEFGFSSMLSGQPEKLVLRGIDLDLAKTATGWNIPEIMEITASLLDRTRQDSDIAKTLPCGKLALMSPE